MPLAAVRPPAVAALDSLPPLGGRLLLAYRMVWFLIAAAACAFAAALLFETGMDPAILVLRLVKSLVLIAVSAILFRRRQGDTVAALLSLAFLLWTITSSFDLAESTWWPPLLDRLRFLLFALALLLFPNGRWTPWWTRHVAVAAAAVFLLGVAESLALLSTRLFLPLAILCVLASLGALFARYRRIGEGAEKQQLKWVTLGLSGGIAFILAARAGDAWADAFGADSLARLLVEGSFQLGIVVLAVGFLVSLLRYRLYDAEAVISRSAALAVLTVCLVAIFAASETLIEMLGQRHFGAGAGDISGAAAAAVAAVLLAPLNDRISNWAELRFQRDLATLRRDLPELLAELSAASSTARVGRTALPKICEALQASQGALLVDGAVVAAHGISAAQVRRLTASGDGTAGSGALFPVRFALRCPFGGDRGSLLLGGRPDGTMLGKDDLAAAGSVVAPLRQALFAARERERDRLQERRDRKATALALKQLAARVSELERAAGGLPPL